MTQTASRLKEIIQPPPHPTPPSSPHNRYNLTTSLKQKFSYGIFRNIHIFAFKMLQESSSWASRNGAVQIFFLTLKRNMFTGKFVVKSEKFLAVLREHTIFNVKWVEAHQMSKVFERNCIVKCMIFFASFCCLWDFLLENLKLKKNSVDVYWNVWTNIKTLYA